MTVLEQENSLACNGAAAWQVLADFGNFCRGQPGVLELHGLRAKG